VQARFGTFSGEPPSPPIHLVYAVYLCCCDAWLSLPVVPSTAPDLNRNTPPPLLPHPTYSRPASEFCKACHFQDLISIRKGVWLYENASVAATTRHCERFLDLRKPALRTVYCMYKSINSYFIVTSTDSSRGQSRLDCLPAVECML
jgi:hypothetical protein